MLILVCTCYTVELKIVGSGRSQGGSGSRGGRLRRLEKWSGGRGGELEQREMVGVLDLLPHAGVVRSRGRWAGRRGVRPGARSWGRPAERLDGRGGFRPDAPTAGRDQTAAAPDRAAVGAP